MLDIDLSEPLNQVRAIIGDIDGSWISNANIEYLLTKHNNNSLQAAIEALDYVLSQVAYYVREEAGDVEVHWKDLYEQLSDRRDKLNRDSVYTRSKSLFYFGGTSKTDMQTVRDNSESTGLGFQEREFTAQLTCLGIDPLNPYISSYDRT
jgi:hypothetical protein